MYKLKRETAVTRKVGYFLSMIALAALLLGFPCEAVASLADDIVQQAENRLGGHYRWGAHFDGHADWSPYTYGNAPGSGYGWVCDLSQDSQPRDPSNKRCANSYGAKYETLAENADCLAAFTKDCESWALDDCATHGHYDCSGLVWLVLDSAESGLPSRLFPGLTIDNRSARDMYSSFQGNKTTDLSKAARGDIVFFASCKYRNDHPEQHIQHVGIFVGNGEVISSEGSPCSDLALSGTAPGVRRQSLEYFDQHCDPSVEPGDYENPKGAYPYAVGRLSQPTHLDCDIPTVKCGLAADLCVVLKDSGGTVLPGLPVHITVDGTAADRVTDAAGRACISWTPSHAGDYVLHASFAGSDHYEASSKDCPFNVAKSDSEVTVRPQNTKCSDPFSLSACLKAVGDGPLSGRILHFSVKGKHYSDATTGPDGCAQAGPYYTCSDSLTVGDYGITASWDGDDCYNPDSGSSNLKVACDPTTLTDDESLAHRVQYSDVITLGGWLKDEEGLQLTGKMLRFDVGGQFCQDYTGPNGASGCQPDNDLSGRNGYASCSIKIEQPSTTCVPINSGIGFAGTDCYCPSKQPINVKIDCETATLQTDWRELVRCDGTNGSGATITLRANLTEEPDGSYGDITKPGQMLFEILQATESGDVALPALTAPIAACPNAVAGGAPDRGCAEVTLPMAEGIYWITASAPDRCYYCSEPDTDCLVIFCDGFVTGGGWITCPDGAKKNFGFNLKYKKNSQTVPQGQFQYLDRAMGIKLHSTRWDWLVVDEANRVAWFQGSGTINHAGSFDFLVKITDKDEPGHPTDPSDTVYDTFSITIKPHGRGNTFPYPCMDSDACPIQDGIYKIVDCPLGGGNIQIHKPHSQ